MVILNVSVVTFTLHNPPAGQFGHKYVLETECFTDGLEKQVEKILYVIYLSCYVY